MTAIFEPGISSRSLAGSWKVPLFQLALVCSWVVLLYRETLGSMVSIWARSETFAHGFAVLPIALWLVWRQRQSLRLERPSASWLATGLLLPAGAVWLAGYLASANVVAQFALVGLLAGSIPALLGWRVARRLAFPLAFLLFAVPFGEFMLPRLMDWTASFTVLGLRLTGVPVYRDGLEFVIPTGTWSVVEACSGIRYLIASLMAGSLFAYLNYRTTRRRLLFMGVSIAVPVVANWLRAYLIVMIGHLSGNELAVGADHLVYGWVFFGIVISLMFFIGSRWSEGESAAAPPGPDLHLAAMAQPLRAGGWGRTALTGLAVAVPVLLAAGLDSLGDSDAPVLAWDPGMLATQGWRPIAAHGEGLAGLAPGEGAHAWQQVFEREGQRVGVLIAYYRHQSGGHKLDEPVRSLLAGANGIWHAAREESRRISPGSEPAAVNAATLRPRATPGAGEVTRLWHWYWAGGRMTASPQWARIYAAWSRLRGRGGDGAVIVLHAPAGQPGGAEAALEAFRRSAGGAISRILNETRSHR